MRFSLLSLALAGPAFAQIAEYGQCGGIGYTGDTTCASDLVCCSLNDWYSQCVEASSCSTTASATSTTDTTTIITSTASATATPGTGATGGFKWFGMDESVAEWGTNIPGTWGVDFYFPSTTAIGTLMSQGYNIFRVPFLMERMAPVATGMTGTLDAGYLANYSAVITYITSNGGYAVIDAHNYGRYNGAIITSTSDFQIFWQNLASEFKSDANAVFDTNNEYHDMDQTLVLDLNQAAINGIRAAGATSQYVFVEGNGWTGAWTWNTTNTNLASLTDPENKIIYEMHQYLDSDGSGSSETCASSDVGVQRVVGATEWLRDNGKLGFLGKFAGGPDSVCMDAVTGMLEHMKANSDVWLGACWWAAGPWWGTVWASFEPPSGTSYEYYDSTLQVYAP